MLNALNKLVEIGKNGTEKQQDNPLSIAKVGDLKEDGKYYSQEYKVTSKSDFNTYEISKTTGMPKESHSNLKSAGQRGVLRYRPCMRRLHLRSFDSLRSPTMIRRARVLFLLPGETASLLSLIAFVLPFLPSVSELRRKSVTYCVCVTSFDKNGNINAISDMK